MPTKPHMTGMQGVYLVAAELTKWGLVVSPTSRSAFGADLLVTDQKCKRAWSVQVKTNAGRPTFWLLNKHASESKSDTHIYVLVNLGQKNPRQRRKGPDFYVVPSRVLARRMRTTPPRGRTHSIFYSIFRDKVESYENKWKIFGRGVEHSVSD
jgi:hypothetical protein